MSTPLGVPVQLAGKQYTLRYTRRALYQLETETDKTILEVLERVQRGSFAAIVDLVWAGIVHANKRLTPEDVADMLEASDLPEVAKKLVEAMSQMNGDNEGNAQDAGT